MQLDLSGNSCYVCYLYFCASLYGHGLFIFTYTAVLIRTGEVSQIPCDIAEVNQPSLT